MATGASNADLAIVLVDARKGLLTQTHRHSIIASLLGVRHVVLAVNKIDLVGYDETTFRDIVTAYRKFAEPLGFRSLFAIPLSARYGDNVSSPSAAHALVRGRASHGLSRAHRGRGGPPHGALPPAGAMDQPAAPRLPRRRRHDRQRADREGRPDRRRRLRPADDGRRDLRRRRGGGERRGRRRRHADARRRARHRPRRRAVASGQPAGGRRPVHRAT